jgi:hypothetical protein
MPAPGHIPDLGFEGGPRFHSRGDTSEIVDLKFVELPEKFPRNLDLFQFVTDNDGLRNPFEASLLQVQFVRNQSLHDIVVKRQRVCNLLLR